MMGRTHVRAAYINVRKKEKGKKSPRNLRNKNKCNRDNFLRLRLLAPQATMLFTTAKWK